jgi:uncharacterized protein (TIGR04255 family)
MFEAYMGRQILAKKKYKKPAVQEAIVEAKFQYERFDAALPGQVFERIRTQFPRKKNLELVTIVLGAAETVTKPSLPPQAPVMQAWKEDESELVQFGPGIVAANRLKYTSWEEFLPAIRAILEAYISVAEPQFLTRLGTRYINRFLIPDKNVNLNDYFQIGVSVPNTFQNLQGFDLTFLHRLHGPTGISASEFEIRTKFITDALKPGEIGTRFILDIDCYCLREITPNIDAIVSLATEAHDTLETIFESLLTDRTRHLMEIGV